MAIKFWLILLLLGLSAITIWPIFLPGYFSHHDDLHIMRIFQMRRCFEDLQIPCRWVPDMGYGNGYPLFNYYNPFAFYIGAILSFLLGFIWAAKMLFLIPLILGGIAMYLLVSEIFDKKAGLLAGILFLFAPYRALDSYVRGAVAESFAIALIPLVFYFGLRLVKEKNIFNIVALVISLAAFLLSHTIMILLFLPVFLLTLIFWLLKETKNIKPLILSLILGIGLSAFFTVPAFGEKNLVQIDNLTKLDLDFRAHFVTLNQLFLDRGWGYGASFPGVGDTISFQIGWPHWWLAFAAFTASLFVTKNKFSSLAIFVFAIFAFSLFMTHVRSAFIWEAIGILHFTQFPWRFLGLVIFAASILGGYLVKITPEKYKNILLVSVALVTILLNWGYFKPQQFYFDLTDQKKLSGELFKIQQKAAVLDFLPKGVPQPKEAAPDGPIIRSGKAEIVQFEKRSNSFEFSAKVLDRAKFELPIFDFPNWQIKVNGVAKNHTSDNYLRRISVELEPGEYKVSGKFKNTLIRTLSNAISLVSLLSLFAVIFYGKLRKIYH